MSIEFWMLLWKTCLIGSVIAFAVLAVFVTIAGGFDVRRLLQRLRDL